MDWSYEAWPSGAPYDWSPAERGDSEFDNIDFHVDLGCGRKKKGRIGIDRYPADGVDIVGDLDALIFEVEDTTVIGLPFEDDSIESIISHHCLEHIGAGFLPLMDDCYRVLKPGGIFRIIVPLFPSRTAVEDPDHCRYFMTGTFDSLCGTPGDSPSNCWLASFSVPYTKARFQEVDKDYTPPVAPEDQWGDKDARELRVALRAMK